MNIKAFFSDAWQWLKQDVKKAGVLGLVGFIFSLLSPLIVLASAYYTADKLRNTQFTHEVYGHLVEGAHFLSVWSFFILGIVFCLLFQRSWLIRGFAAFLLVTILPTTITSLQELENNIGITEHHMYKVKSDATGKVAKLEGYTYASPDFPREVMFHDVIQIKGKLVYDSTIAGACRLRCDEVREMSWHDDTTLKLTCEPHTEYNKKDMPDISPSLPVLYVNTEQPVDITYTEPAEEREANEARRKADRKLPTEEAREAADLKRRLESREKRRERVEPFCQYFSDKPFK